MGACLAQILLLLRQIMVKQMKLMKFEKVQLSIAREYCRSIIIIDDVIFEKNNGGKLESHYQKFFESCESDAVLCHMHEFRAETSEDETAIRKGVELAKKSDIVVLDWYLWHSDPEKKEHTGTSESAVEIIQRLADENSLRFIFIYTLTPVENVVEILKKEFADEIINITERVKVKSENTNTDPQYLSYKKLYIGVHHKGRNAANDSSKLLGLVHELLTVSYSDYLHWAGLEMSVRVRDMMPKILASLPEGTNGPLLYQFLFQEDEEISDQIVEVLLDELKVQFHEEHLKMVESNFLSEELKLNLKDVFSADILKDKSILNRKIHQLSETVTKRGQINNEVDKCNKAVPGFFDIKKHEYWAQLRESVLMFQNQKGSIIRTGHIFMGKPLNISNNKNENSEINYDYILCLSPMCDCHRPEDKKLIFIRGSENIGSLSKSVHTQYVTNGKPIIWDARFIETYVLQDLKDFERFGALRKDFVSRIIQRVWNHQTRVGVDSSELMRRKRDE
jgi:hypothetical protein